jgi:hypothetical protein
VVQALFSILGLVIFLLFAAPASAADDGERLAFIDVVGAPGDGEEALERAMSNKMLDRGFAVTGTPAVGAYEIQGMVRLAPTERGRETIRIDWTIFGPEGNRIGNVTQTREIRKGSLDRHWGPAADAAAEAAAQDILKLLQDLAAGTPKAPANP